VAADVQSNIVPWTEGPIPAEHVLRGFYGALLDLPQANLLDPILLDAFGYDTVETRNGITRYEAKAWPGKFLATRVSEEGASLHHQGTGSIHHIAFQAATDTERDALRQQVMAQGLQATGIVDRHYFHATYFMTPAAILFEISTNDIGFTVDEPAAELGTNLRLPSQYQSAQAVIEASLTPLDLPRTHL
jgi:glyoxalase family protein